MGTTSLLLLVTGLVIGGGLGFLMRSARTFDRRYGHLPAHDAKHP